MHGCVLRERRSADDEQVRHPPVLQVSVHDAGVGRCAHDGPALYVRAVISVGAIAALAAAPAAAADHLGSGDARHGVGQLDEDLGCELCLAVLVIGPVDRDARQRIAPFVGVGRVKIDEVVLVGEVLSRIAPAAADAVIPLDGGLLPLRTPVARRGAGRNPSKRGERTAAAAEHAAAQNAAVFGQAVGPVEIVDSEILAAGAHEAIQRFVEYKRLPAPPAARTWCVRLAPSVPLPLTGS